MVSSGVAPPPILVTGMHRSGMSATTGLLAHLGVYVGGRERLQSGDVHNPEGHHELLDAVTLNDRLLDWCGLAWDLPPELAGPHFRLLQPPPDLAAQLKSLVASMDAEAAAVGRPWAVKDPRLSVLWPFWLEAKPNARVVLCVRNPAAIAQSLKIRNGLSLRFGLKLSERYFEHLLSIPKERIDAQVRYEELVSDPENVARDLVCNLCLESDIDRTRMAISSVKAELAQNRGRLESVPASIDSHSISQAYARMLAHGPAPVVEPVNPPTLVTAPTSSPAGEAFERRVAVPPRELQDWVGGGGPSVFKATGDEFVGYLADLCGLQPGDAMLDVGCGSGRMALPLTGYLNREGRYAGFDISAEAIAWCTENISGSHPNFDFTLVDIYNGAYNPTGTYKSSDFRFPYPDESFDVVLLASLFTHMLPSDVEHYLHEIVRVLKPGGRSLITFFLLNEESSALITEGKSSFDFEHEMPGYRMNHAENPEAAIAYPEAFVRWLYGECGLELREPSRYGTWCGRTNGMSGQDVVIAVKPARLDQTCGINSINPDPIAELGRQAAAAGVGTASLDGVLCQASSTSAATTPVEVSGLNAGGPRLILAGHSHLRAIAGRAIVSESSELVAGPHGDGTLIMVGPGPKRDMSYFDTLADLATGADVGILWNGNEHNTLYLFEAETPFDFLSAHVRKMNPSAQMKSRAAIRDRFRQLSIDVLDVVLTRLATGGLNRIALIGTPPPKGDNEALRALLQAEEFFVNWAAQLGHSVETVPITDPYVRLKLWYLLQDMLAEEARIRGLMFIPVPEEVQDADGFLKREFWQDVTHANRAYGNVMYKTVLRAFE